MTRTTRTSAPNGPRKRETSGKRGAGAGAEALDGSSAQGTDWMAGGDVARAMDAPGVANGVAHESEGAAMGARLVTGESSGDASELTDGLETPRLPSTLGQTTSRLSVPVQGVSNGPAASQPAAPAPADGARTRDGAGPMAGQARGRVRDTARDGRDARGPTVGPTAGWRVRVRSHAPARADQPGIWWRSAPPI